MLVQGRLSSLNAFIVHISQDILDIPFSFFSRFVALRFPPWSLPIDVVYITAAFSPLMSAIITLLLSNDNGISYFSDPLLTLPWYACNNPVCMAVEVQVIRPIIPSQQQPWPYHAPSVMYLSVHANANAM